LEKKGPTWGGGKVQESKGMSEGEKGGGIETNLYNALNRILGGGGKKG